MFLIAGAKEMKEAVEDTCLWERERIGLLFQRSLAYPSLWKDAPPKLWRGLKLKLVTCLSPRGTIGLWVGPRYIWSAPIGIWLFQAQLFIWESLLATCTPPLTLPPRLRRTLGCEAMQCLIMGIIETSQNTVTRWPRVIEANFPWSPVHACRAFLTASSPSQSMTDN